MNEREFTFKVSGMLWQRSLVMMDEETGSLWSHLLGRSMRGEMEGQVLETLPGSIVTWKAWKKAYPETTVLALSRTADEFVKEFHETPNRFVLGLRSLQAARAYPFDVLLGHPVVNDDFDSEPVVIFFDRDGVGGRVYSRRSDGNALTFRVVDGVIVDESGQQWGADGVGLTGAAQGKRLTEIPAIPSFAEAWRQFYPNSTFYREER